VYIGDTVEYNVNQRTNSLIYIKVIKSRKRQVRSERSITGDYFPDRVTGPPPGFIFGLGGGGEMANMTLASHDPYDEFSDDRM
jgi:hypothetical protein